MNQLDEIIDALRFVAQTGCPNLGQDCRIIMQQHYQHHRRAAWTALTPEEQDLLKKLMKPEVKAA